MIYINTYVNDARKKNKKNSKHWAKNFNFYFRVRLNYFFDKVKLYRYLSLNYTSVLNKHLPLYSD